MGDRIRLYRSGLGEHYLVLTEDRHLFRCRVQSVARGSAAISAAEHQQPPSQLRWVFRDGEHDYIGPPFAPLEYLDELQVLVNEWWKTRCAIGQT